MKYTAKQIRDISIPDWIGLMAKELNEKGFLKQELDSATELPVERPYKSGDNLQYFLYSEVNSWDELEYLKEIGLLNNGRCSICGKVLRKKPLFFQCPNKIQQSLIVCNNCGNKNKGG